MRRISFLVVGALMMISTVLMAGVASAQERASMYNDCYEDVETGYETTGDVCVRFIYTPSGNFEESSHFFINDRLDPSTGEGALPLHKSPLSGGPNQPGDFVVAGALTPTGDIHGGIHVTGANAPPP